MRSRRYLLAIAAAIVTVTVSWMPAARAQAGAAGYPSKSIRWVAPVPPGSPPDAVARRIAEGVAARLNVPVIVDNKPGAGGSIGTAEVARSEPDGYTYLVALSDAFTSTTALVKVPYDPLRDFTFIGKLASNGPVLLVHASHKSRILRELVDAAKGSKEGPSYGSFGQGSFPQLVMEALGRQAGVKFREIPYRGSPLAMQDLLGNRIALAFTGPNLVGPLVADGKVRPLAIIGSKRSPLLPDVPTFAEAGFDSFFARNLVWIGVAGPAGLPQSMAGRMGDAARAAVRDPAIAKWLSEVGWEVVAGTASEFKRELQVELPTVIQFIRGDLGIQPH